MAELEVKRKEMVDVGMQVGLSNAATLRLSQEMDLLHNQWIHLNDKESQQHF